MDVVAHYFLREKKKMGYAAAVETNTHQTQLERDWNAFTDKDNAAPPSKALIGAVAARLEALLLIEYSRLKSNGAALNYDNDRMTALLYHRWTNEVDNFHLNEYYPLMGLTSTCLTCAKSHTVDIVWNNSGRDAALPHTRTVRQRSWESRFHEVAASARLVSEQMVGA